MGSDGGFGLGGRFLRLIRSIYFGAETFAHKKFSSQGFSLRKNRLLFNMPLSHAASAPEV
jgi:hypothetical protein